MRNRRYRKPSLPTQNLDSFLDILTNTVGVLMFITLFITLLAVESSNVVRTPLRSNSNKQPRFFEVRGNRITYIDDTAVESQLTRSLPTCEPPEVPDVLDSYNYQYYANQVEIYQNCRLSLLQQLQNFRGQTSHYTARFLELGSLLYEPIDKESGETPKDIKQAESEFNRVLGTLNPQNDYLAFIVRPDSFSAFRTARKEADQLGFDVGWEPFTQETPIVFGSGGRTIGVQ
ncbi:MAG: hypothetical protein AB4041_01825 [Microcystaceae cyanobacterium]